MRFICLKQIKRMVSCKLRCLENPEKSINLLHLQETFIGRDRFTDIRDSSVSRKQLKLVANLEDYLVHVTALGINPSGVNGFFLKRNEKYTLHHRDIIEILPYQYFYEIVFDPPPEKKCENEDELNLSNKRKRDEDAVTKNPKQLKLNDIVQKNDEWEVVDDKNLYIFTSTGVKPSEKIAGYDMDGTIIATKSGARFAKDVNDWQFAFSEVPKKIKDLYNRGYKIVFFTNQAGISTGKTKVSDIKIKIENIIKKIVVPIQVFIAPTRTVYRKPGPGMWNALCEMKNGNVEVDKSNSFYVGDAAGREKNWAPKKNKDHSVADRLFALNIGVDFFTPEEHFLGARKVPFTMPVFDPRNSLNNTDLCEPKSAKITSNEQEVVVMVGCPGSGKSFVCKNYLVLNNYTHINRDQLGSWQKCCKALEESIRTKKSVVIDNTNPDKESRKRYIDIANKYKVPCRCFVMNTSIHQAKHNNLFREITDKNHEKISEIIINSYKNKFQEPTMDEGFSEIVKVNCIQKFNDSKLKELYQMFLLEK